MKKSIYIYALFLVSIISTGYAQKSQDSIPKLDGIVSLIQANLDAQTGEQLYNTAVEVTLPEGVVIERVSASIGIKVGNKWQETFSFFEVKGGTNPQMKKFDINGSTLRFDMGTLPEKYKVRVILYESKTKRYHVKLKELKK